MSNNRITLTDREKERLKKAVPYLQSGDWDRAFYEISNSGYNKMGGN